MRSLVCTRPHELGEGAGLVQVLFDEAAGVGQPLVAGRGQGDGLGRHAAQPVAQHCLDVPGLGLSEGGAGERDEQFAHQGVDGDDRGAFGVEQGRPAVGGEADGVEAASAVEAVFVPGVRRNPHGAVVGGDPGAVFRGDREHARTDVDQLVVVVAVPVDGLAAAEEPCGGRRDGLVADLRHV